MRLLKLVDRRISVGMESTARRLNRRELLYKGTKYAAAATAAASVGDLGFASEAFAKESLLFKCCSPYSAKCGSGQRPAGCPGGWAVCTTKTQCECVYSNGYWVSTQCSPCGAGKGSYRICIDCYKIGTKCADLCTIVTDCQCPKCSTPAEVKTEMLRLQEELAPSASAS